MTDAPRSTGTDTAPPLPIGTIDLAIGGMTCASCVARVEKKLNKVPGAQAVVNLVTEVAVDLHAGATSTVTITSDAPLADDDVRAAIDEAGYVVVA